MAILGKLLGRSSDVKTDPTLNENQPSFALLDNEQLLRLARSYDWVHTIRLGEHNDSLLTPGRWGRGNPEIWKAFDKIDFRGKRVLDIGCWDGQWSFEAEARGASEIVATDLISQRDFTNQKTFEVAAALRRSKAIYLPNVSVYDVTLLQKTFDIVLYMGIYYHLKDPLQAFTALRNVLCEGGQMLTEGAILEDAGCFAKFFYREQFCGENSNWWVPTRDCLRQWVECSFFEIAWEGTQWGHGENQRHCLLGQAVHGPDPLYSRPPEGLEHFNAAGSALD